jgi:DHA1 family bicyclomycin/chloramphenicol resistance-like MFS transporter
MVAVGPLSDRFGRRKIILAGLGIYVLAGIGCAASRSIPELSICRLLQGMGGAAGIVLTRAIVRDLFARSDASRVLSSMMMAVGLAPLIAPIIGAQLLSWGNWRIVFGFLALAGAALFIIVASRLPESSSRRDPDALKPVVIVRGYATFFRDPVCLGNATAIACLYGGMLAYLSGSPFILIEGFGASETVYSFILALSSSALVAGSAVNRRLIRSFRPNWVLEGGLVLLLVASAAMVMMSSLAAGGIAGFVAPVAAYVFSFGLIAPNATAEALDPLPHKAGVGASAILFIQACFGALSGYFVNLGQDGTSASTVAVMAILAAGAFLSRRWAVTRMRANSVAQNQSGRQPVSQQLRSRSRQ